MGIFAVFGFIYLVYNLIKESIEDARCRQRAFRNGYETYWSPKGHRKTSTGGKLTYEDQKKYYKI